MKKLVALVSVLCLLVASVPAMATDFDLGALNDLLTMEDETEPTEEFPEEKIEHMFEGETVEVELAGETIEVHVNFKEAMDSYIEFMDEYANYVSDPVQNADSGIRMWIRYAELLEMLDGLEEDESEMSVGDLAYYFYALNSITAKMATIE